MMTPPVNYEEGARALNVSVRTVKRLVKRREISHTRIAGCVRFTEAHLTEYIERNTRKAVERSGPPAARRPDYGRATDLAAAARRRKGRKPLGGA